jgi:hypothetical protein
VYLFIQKPVIAFLISKFNLKLQNVKYYKMLASELLILWLIQDISTSCPQLSAKSFLFARLWAKDASGIIVSAELLSETAPDADSHGGF